MSQSDFVTRGQALVASGQFQEAVKVCRLGLLGRPTTVEGRIVLGQALLALKRYDEVLAEMRVALELDHSSADAYLLKGDALLKKGDVPAALDVLAKAQKLAPESTKVKHLLSEAQNGGARSAVSAVHPSVGFVGGARPDQEPSDSFTKHYPNHADDGRASADAEDAAGNYTKPTSIAAPTGKKKSSKVQSMGGAEIPSAAVLAVGDRSGTVEADPENDGVQLEDDEDFGALAAPPRGGTKAEPVEGARGAVVKAAKSPAPAHAKGKRPARGDVSSVELDSDDMLELDETIDPPREPRRVPGPGTAVRNAVKMPSGPLEAFPPPPSAVRPTAQAPAPLAQMIAQTPHVMQPLPPGARGLAAGLPTAAAAPIPPLGASNVNARTVALHQSAAAVDAMFPEQGPAWARSTVVAGSPNHVGPKGPTAGADEPTRKPDEGLDPRIAALATPQPGGAAEASQSGAVMFPQEFSASGRPLKTGVRRGRSRLQIAMWFLIGAVVIGGGVFAGLQIRSMRLKKQISTARDQAVDLAKADTWQGWSGARDRLESIAKASSTIDNRAALARARAVLAYEFADGFNEASAAVKKLGTNGGLDAAIAASYVALAEADPKTAKTVTGKASELSPNDAAVLYVVGQAALLEGDYRGAITNLRSAQEREPRPLYAVGLARAIAATGAWDDALAAVDRALGAMPDHPTALIERAFMLVASGKIAPGSTITSEVRLQLQKLIAEGGKPFAEQQRGVSPSQLALANLALAQIEFATKDRNAAITAMRAAAAVGADEQRFGEEAIDTLYMFGDVENAKTAAVRLLAQWPNSRRTRILQAQVMLALGVPAEALEILSRSPEAANLPRGTAVRGWAKLTTGDIAGARADFDTALKKLPALEIALVGRASIDIADDDVEEAKKRIEPKYNPSTSSVAMTTVYAAILRHDPAGRERAKQLLEKVISGPAYVDVPRAYLELGRVYRDLGDMRAARGALSDAVRTGNQEARLELGLLNIEDRDATQGKDMLDALVKDAKGNAPASLLLAAARAHMLAGDNTGASELLDLADKLPSVVRWEYDRERGRLALRKGDLVGAAQLLARALDTSGADPETFLVAGDVVATDYAKQAQLATKVKTLAAQRLKDAPEKLVITGKLAVGAENYAEAATVYAEAIKVLEKATPRRRAQAHYGAAVTAYFQEDDPATKAQLDLALELDPSLYVAYIFALEISDTNQKGFALAEKAVKFNPDYVEGWYRYGLFAGRLRKAKDLDVAITRLGALAPGSDKLAEVQALKR